MSNRGLLGMIFLLLAGCLPHARQAEAIHERHSNLGVPLASEEGQIKLAVLGYLSQETLKESKILFVPLTEEQIRRTYHGHSQEFRAATRAEYKKNVGLRDKGTKERGVLLMVGKVTINGVTAKVDGGYKGRATITYTFHLEKENAQWRVREVDSEMISHP